jgi:hypothetical protein
MNIYKKVGSDAEEKFMNLLLLASLKASEIKKAISIPKPQWF